MFCDKLIEYACSLLHCRDMKNAVIGNRNQKEKFVQSQVIPKYDSVLSIFIVKQESLGRIIRF